MLFSAIYGMKQQKFGIIMNKCQKTNVTSIVAVVLMEFATPLHP